MHPPLASSAAGDVAGGVSGVDACATVTAAYRPANPRGAR